MKIKSENDIRVGCPICNKDLTLNALRRHLKSIHGLNAKEIKKIIRDIYNANNFKDKNTLEVKPNIVIGKNTLEAKPNVLERNPNIGKNTLEAKPNVPERNPNIGKNTLEVKPIKKVEKMEKSVKDKENKKNIGYYVGILIILAFIMSISYLVIKKINYKPNINKI